MRRHLPILLTLLALIAGCNKVPAPLPQSKPKPPQPTGVALADLDLRGAPALNLTRTQPPVGIGPATDLIDLAFSSATDGLAVTQHGTIERTRDGGVSWTQVFELAGSRFTRIESVDSQVAFAVARRDCHDGAPGCGGPQLLRTTDGGENWQVIEPDLTAVLLPYEREALAYLPWLRFQFLSAEVGFAAGDRNEQAVLRAFPLVVTTDGGRTWQKVPLPEEFTYNGGHFFTSPTHGYVTVYSQSGEYRLMETDDGGQSWRTLYATTQYPLYAVHFPTTKVGYIAGGINPRLEEQPRQVVLATHDAGATWSPVSLVENRGQPIVELQMISPTEGWAARGGCWSMGANGPCGGPLLFTQDGGKSWEETGHGVSRIRAVGKQAWVRAGDGATTLLRTTDGGLSWQQFARPDSLRVSEIQFISPRVGYIQTNQGAFQTRDGGSTWAPYPVDLSGVHFLDEGVALRIGDRNLERSTDGGLTWHSVAISLPPGTEYLIDAQLAVAGGQSVWLSHQSDACPNLECPALLRQSGDGGATWQAIEPRAPMRLRAMAFADASHGVGLTWRNRLLLTADGGKNWSQQLGRQDVSFDGVSYAGSAAELWLAGSYMSGIGISTSLLIHSTDGAGTWRVRQGGASIFEQLQFVSAKEGWLISRGLNSSGLYVTHDGGETWTEVWPRIQR